MGKNRSQNSDFRSQTEIRDLKSEIWFEGGVMAKLGICGSCGGFVPGKTCPHCGNGTMKILAVAAGTAIAFTLMACYGRPPCKDGTKNCYDTDAAPASSATPPQAAPDGAK
jgi:hypothetical protein